MDRQTDGWTLVILELLLQMKIWQQKPNKSCEQVVRHHIQDYTAPVAPLSQTDRQSVVILELLLQMKMWQQKPNKSREQVVRRHIHDYTPPVAQLGIKYVNRK